MRRVLACLALMVLVGMLPAAAAALAAEPEAVLAADDLITSGELPVVSIQASLAVMQEQYGNPSSFTVSRSGAGSDEPLDVYLNVGGSARSETDYRGMPASPLRLEATETSRTIALTPVPELLLEGDENVVVTVRPDAHYVVGAESTATLIIQDYTGYPTLPNALDNDSLPYSTSFDRPWHGQSSHVGRDADYARSALFETGISYLETSVYGPEHLRFRWRASTLAGQNTVEFLIDGVPQAVISGETEWETMNIVLPIGYHRLQWRYVKRVATRAGLDAAYVDQLETPLQSMVYHLYVSALHRAPESAAAYQYWAWYYHEVRMLQIDARQVFAELARRFLLSPEYRAKYPGDRITNQFAIDCYETLFWRRPSQQEINAAVSNVGMGRAEFVSMMIRTPEFAQVVRNHFPGQEGDPVHNLVGQLYYGIFNDDDGKLVLDRMKHEQYGLATYVQRVGSAYCIHKRGEMIAAAKDLFLVWRVDLLNKSRNKSLLEAELANRLYLAFLGRVPVEAERLYWEWTLASGRMTLNQCIDYFGYTGEFSEILRRVFPCAPDEEYVPPDRSSVAPQDYLLYE